jgi:tripartite-type tricarboxylate transporter receptor subunit TctC
MPATSRRGVLAAAAAVGFALGPRPASAQGAAGGFPDRPLRIIVPYNAGGITDVMSRAAAQALTPVLGQAVVVENRPGANGSVGTHAAARAPGDGYTLTMGITDTFAINPSTFRTLPYDPERDFVPVTMVARVPFALMVGPSQREIITFVQLSAEARRERARLSFASWGVGSSSHLAMEFIAASQGFEKLHVPFTGQAPGMQAVASGQVDAMVLPVGGAEQLARDGRARIVAVAAPQRVELVPNAPTLTELGVPLSTGLWLALYAPARTPEPVVARLNAAVREAVRNEALVAAFRNQAAVPEPSTPEELAAFQRRERAQWAEVVRNAKIVVE